VSRRVTTPRSSDNPAGARVLVGVPAFRGAAHIAETLRSIQRQDFGAFDALISVDNGDRATTDVCQPFLADPRFRVVVHDRHLQWAGNLNWLFSQLQHDFFCYWPQDDQATPDYLGQLVRHADAHPDWACTFSDIEWFGHGKAHLSFPSLDGPPLTRALYVFESLNGVPFRGLVRRDALDRAGPLRSTPFESAHEDFVWLTKLAREGKFGRVEGPLYLKRRHDDSLSLSWHQRDAAWRRAVWLEFGIGMLEAILPVVPANERDAALAIVLERLCCPKEGRVRFYDPLTEPAAFAGDFLRAARARCGITASSPAADDPIIRETLGPWLDAAEIPPATMLLNSLTQSGATEISFRAGGLGTRLLDLAWSVPEAWGTWNAAPSVSLSLPLPQDGRWAIELLCRGHAHSGHTQTVHVDVDDASDVARWHFDSLDDRWLRLVVWPRNAATTIRFRCPDAIAPLALGRSDDNRPLALALIVAKISRP
jgi:glycosyltransferase involved in cell wall biosynthesis